MEKINQKNKKNKVGFMMIEAVLSIFIVGITLVAFLAILGGTSKVEFGKRDYVIAANLAQEGIEIVRNIRDNNWKNGKTAFESPFPANGGGYCVEYNKNYDNVSPTNNCSTTSKKLQKNSDGFYEYNSGETTKFSRNVVVKNGDNCSGCKEVTSTVTWRPNGAASDTSITVDDKLFSWGDTN